MANKTAFNPLEIIANSTGALVYVIDLKTYEILYTNERCQEEFGDVLGKVCYKTLHVGEDAPCSFCPIQASSDPLSYPVGSNFEWENQNSINGRYYLFNDRVVEWEGKRKVKVQVGIDITEQKLLENKLLEEKNSAITSFEALIDSTIEGLIIYNEDKICIQTNKVAPKIFGYEESEMIGMAAWKFIAPESLELVKSVIIKENQEPYEAVMLRKDGTKFPAILRGHNLVLAGENLRVSATMDITDMKKYEEKILRLAHYDTLTKLPNRILLKEYIQKSIKHSKRTSYYNALLFIDLDNFKVVNDTVGHDVGDMVLIETAKRIQDAVRDNDVVARLGGDEFVVLVNSEEINRDKIVDNLGFIGQKILTSLQELYLINNHEFRITASIGIKIFNDDTFSMSELMKYADSAMYNAKSEGRNTFRFFNPELQKIMENKISLLDNLRKAIFDNSMALHYQPQIYSETEEQKVGVEALIRWNHETQGLIPPDKFIPIAEESGLIIQLGEWILEESIAQIKAWEKDTQKRNWRVSINVSSKQFEEPNFMSMIEQILKRHCVKSEMIRLELTERILIKNIDETLIKLQALKDMGISLSIDDFGTGYSSLSYLKKLPIDELKIDKSFISDLTTDKNDEIITRTIISIGTEFGLEVIAEGVETKEQYDKLRSLGCKYFQGYLFSKPVPAELL